MSNQDAIVDVIEELAHRIRRSVAVDDADLIHIGHSSHQFGDDDPIRHQTLIERETPAEIRDRAIAHGLYTWKRPYRLPAMGRLGFVKDRLAFPLRSETELVGVMWIILDSGFSDEDRRNCETTAAIVEDLLLDRREERVSAEQRLDCVLAQVVSDDADERARGIVTLREANNFSDSTQVGVLSVSFNHSADDIPPRDHMSLLRRVWGQTTAIFDNRAITAITSAHGFGLVGMSGALQLAELTRLSDVIHQRVQPLDSSGGSGLHVGVGDVVGLDRIHVAFAHAEQAREIAIDEGAYRVVWEERPFEVFIASVLRSQVCEEDLPPVIANALGRQPDDVLSTLLAYLDAGNNAAVTAERLHVHRATVYYRLKQFEKSTGIRLADGRTRLMVHLWLLMRDRID